MGPNSNFSFCISAFRVYLLKSGCDKENKRLFDTKHAEISYGRDGVYLGSPNNRIPEFSLTENKHDTQLTWSLDGFADLIMERYEPTREVREATVAVIEKLKLVA